MDFEAISLPERDVEHERVISIVFNIPPQQAALISCLSRGAVATTQQLQEYLESKTHPKIVVTHVRSRLREDGMDIKSKWNVGYWMDAKTRDEIKARIDQFVEGR